MQFTALVTAEIGLRVYQRDLPCCDQADPPNGQARGDVFFEGAAAR